MQGLRVWIRRAFQAWAVLSVSVPALTANGQSGRCWGPCALVASRDATTLYVANAGARQVAWVELLTGQVTRCLGVPAEPTGLVLSPDGTKLIVTCAAPKSTVVVIDLVSCRTIATHPGGAYGHGRRNQP